MSRGIRRKDLTHLAGTVQKLDVGLCHYTVNRLAHIRLALSRITTYPGDGAVIRAAIVELGRRIDSILEVSGAEREVSLAEQGRAIAAYRRGFTAPWTQLEPPLYPRGPRGAPTVLSFTTTCELYRQQRTDLRSSVSNPGGPLPIFNPEEDDTPGEYYHKD